MTLSENLKNIKWNKHLISAFVATTGSLAAAYLVYKWRFSRSFSDTEQDTLKELNGFELKEKGNQYYREKKFSEAKESYLLALEKISPEDLTLRSILFSNIAAVCDGLDDLEGIFENSSQAISINPHYPKAYIRRALAFEKSDKMKEYVIDLSTSYVLTGCTDRSRQQIDEIITKLAAKQVEDEFKNRNLSKISAYNIRRFTTDLFPDDIFTEEDLQAVKEEYTPNEQLYKYLEMLEIFRNGDIAICIDKADDVIKQCDESNLNSLQQRVLLFRATCHFAVLNSERTMDDAKLLLSQSSISAKLKIAANIRVVSLHLHTMDLESALTDLQELRALDPDRAHTSYFLGQLYMLLMNFTMAKHCTKRAMNLCPQNVNFQVQMLVIRANEAKASGQQGTLRDVIDELRSICNTHRDNVEFSVELAQLLHDAHEVNEAERRMNAALHIADDVYKPYLLTQKAMQLVSKHRYDEADSLLDESIQIDQYNETAFQMKAVLAYRRERISEAIEAFKSASHIARGHHALVMALATILSLEIQLSIMKQLSLPMKSCSHFTSYLRTFDAI
ncbi:hypothetical protein GJ496_011799 [Pomphorhynchus laevis]|nr:hypothetical protein GJ496_011799 [Pomphorhynchus laevis]